MSKFANSVNVKAEQARNKYPNKCMVDGCDKDTDVVFVIARNRNTGKKRIGAMKEFATLKSGNWILNDNYEQTGWLTRCSGCYMEEYERYRTACST